MFLSLVALCWLAGACSTPETGSDNLATGKARVQDLLHEALATLPEDSDYVVPAEPGRQTCRKTFLGYAVGTTGAHRAEIPTIVDLPSGSDPAERLTEIEAVWRDAGYDVTRPRTADGRFPKVQATVDDYRVVMTAFIDQPPDVPPRVTVYAVSPCLDS